MGLRGAQQLILTPCPYKRLIRPCLQYRKTPTDDVFTCSTSHLLIQHIKPATTVSRQQQTRRFPDRPECSRGAQSCTEADLLHPHSRCLCCSGRTELWEEICKPELKPELVPDLEAVRGESVFHRSGSIMTARIQGATSRGKPVPKSRATGKLLGVEVMMWSGTWDSDEGGCIKHALHQLLIITLWLLTLLKL